MKLVAFTGAAGSGKTTAARVLETSGFRLVPFAGPLKRMVRSLGLTEEQVYGGDKDIADTVVLGGRTARHAMQTLGTEWGRQLIHPDLWVDAWWRNVRDETPTSLTEPKIVVDDCRFPNEMAKIRLHGGVIIEIAREGFERNNSHESESHVPSPDYVILNNAGPDEFAANVLEIVRLAFTTK